MDTPSTPPSEPTSGTPQVPPTSGATPPADAVFPPTPTGAPGTTATPPVTDEPPPPQTLGGWFKQNGIYMLILFAIAAWLYNDRGWSGLWYGFLILFGLSFVVFIHEMGHFLTAKFFDVHVMTFSIGFGPALPGCSFQWGETTYKLSVFPLGGYVRMVGEGSEADEEENYPRSYKNKTVGQRMIIISAGVIMNVLLGAACLIMVYRVAGVPEPPAVVAKVDAGSPLWDAGVQSGMKVVKMNDQDDPTFMYLKRKVALSTPGKPIPFEMMDYSNPAAPKLSKLEIASRRENSPMPVIGLVPPSRLQLVPTAYKGERTRPVRADTAAAAARVFDLAPGETITETTDPDKPDQMKPLPSPVTAGASVAAWQELGRRLRKLEGKPFKIKTDKGERTLADGFDFDDVIVGTTSATRQRGAKYDPLDVEALPEDPRTHEKGWRDPFVYEQRLEDLADRPLVVQVRRGGLDGTPVNVLVPSAYHLVLPGVRMGMGQVAAVRSNEAQSPAKRAGVLPREGDKAGDVISDVVMKAGGTVLLDLKENQLDPVRLPSLLRQAAAQRPGEKKIVELTVIRGNPSAHEAKQKQTLTLDWDENWAHAIEVPSSLASPTSIPELGLAYWIKCQVVQADPIVKPGEEAKGPQPNPLHKDDVVTEFIVKRQVQKRGEVETKWDARKLKVKRGSEKEVYDTWAHVADKMQEVNDHEVKFKVRRDQKEEEVTTTLVEDPTWARADRGIDLMPDFILVKGDSFLDAVKLGVGGTAAFIQDMYVSMLSLITGKISGEVASGPLAILDQGYKLASVDYFALILFLGIISINLAVVNFLPIPLLDGGHMVFLIYEKIRGKPASEQIQAIAAYTGLAILGLAMVSVFVLDIVKMTIGL